MPGTNPLRYQAIDDLAGTPNIVVDGAGNAATVIALSHWPKSSTPHALKADSSAEIVFNYLQKPEFHVTAEAITNNHFDADGLVGIYTLLEPEAALTQRDILVGIGHAGDFVTYYDRRAARIAFTLDAFTDPARSPLDLSIFGLPYPRQCAALYREMLPRLPEMLADTNHFREYWEAEDLALSDTEKALADGVITIEERPAADLAIVRIDDARTTPAPPTVPWTGDAVCHAMAVNNATQCNRILMQHRGRHCLTYRYESWVQYVSYRPAPRVDLAPLAESLTGRETDGAVWQADKVSDIRPRLTIRDKAVSALSQDMVASLVEEHLKTAPPAWDPYDP